MKHKIIFFILLFLVVFIEPVTAQDRYVIDPSRSTIKCSVRYLVVPQIKGEFGDFSGVIYFDPKSLHKSSVLMQIKTASLKTQRKTFDRIILSKQVLDPSKFPEMIFQSQLMKRRDGIYYVKGWMDMHGVTNEEMFSFKVNGPIKEGKQGEYITAEGKWTIDRKDYDVIWHKVLDKGGVIVGDKITIEWAITAVKEK